MKATVTKMNIVREMSDMTGMTRGAMEDAFNAFVLVLQNHLAQGDSVNINGIGTFSVIQRAARKYHNPLTNEQGMIPAKMVPKFKAVQKLKDLVANLNV